MTAPDPTAGEHMCPGAPHCDICAGSDPVAASTGTSEDERMAWCVCPDFGPILPGDTHERRCSDLWLRLAAREAAARAEERERIAQAIEATDIHPTTVRTVARIAREG